MTTPNAIQRSNYMSLFRKTAFLLLSLAATAQAMAQQLPVPPSLAAKSWLLLEMGSNQVLTTEKPDDRLEPASLTKLMTAYLTFSALHKKTLALQQPLPVSEKAWRTGGSKMFIRVDTQVPVEDLIKGMIVQSGNDACVTLAEGIAGSEENFAQMMNREAQRLGMKNSHFMNSTGLPDPQHYTTARDLSLLASALIRDFPEHYATYYALRNYTFNGIKQDNRNMLLGRDPAVDGMKTGYTEAAGYCLVASAVRDTPSGKRRLLSVVMGTASREARAAESQKLLNWGWQAWDSLRLFEAGKEVSTVPVWKGKTATARLGAPAAIYVTVPKGEGEKLKTTVERTDPLVAPLTAGQRVGTLKVTTGSGTAVAEVPLTVLEPVELAGLFGRAWDAIRLWIK